MRRARRTSLAAALMAALTCTTLSAPPAAQAAVFDHQPQILGPVVPTQPSEAGSAGAALGNRFVFAGQGVGTGSELWITDGTRRGTRLVRDILPGTDDSDPVGFTAFEGRVWFQATGAGGAELWVTDGTAAGTKRVRDLVPGPGSGQPLDFRVAGNQMFFSATTPETGRELWVTDGTATRTRLVEDIRPGPTSSYARPLTTLGNRVGLIAQVEPEHYSPLVSDGSAARTYRLDRPDAKLQVSGEMVTVGDQFLFTAASAASGYELRRSRGGPGDATLVKDIVAGANSSLPSYLAVLGGTVMFSAFDSDHGYELWRSNGTNAGTVLVEDILPGDDASEPWYLTRSGDAVYFSAGTAGLGRELWMTRGTAATTRLVRDIAPGDGSSDPYFFGGLGGRMLLVAERASVGAELFVSNGTTTGTRLLSDLYPGAVASDPVALGRARGTFFLRVMTPSGPRLAAYTLPVPTVRGTPRSSYSRTTAARREIRVRIGVRAPGIGVNGAVVLYRGNQVVGRGTVRNGEARVRITVKLGPGRHVLKAGFVGSVDAQRRLSPAFAVRVR